MSIPGLLQSTSSYVVSTTTCTAPYSSSSTDSAEASAFRLLGNLAYADCPRRRIAELDGLVLAAARAVCASAMALAPPSPTTPGAVGEEGAGSPGCRMPALSAAGVGQAAAALLGQLAPVVGAEGSEEQLVAAGEALSAALAAVSNIAGNGDSQAGAPAAADEGRLLGLASEALSGLLILSWSDSCSLEAAAAVDGFVTDTRLAESLVTLWRRAAAKTTPEATHLDFGQLSESVLAVMSSIACRPTGRQALVAAGVASAVVDTALRRARDGGGGGGRVGHLSADDDNGESDGLQLTVTEHSDIIRLLCVLSASPAHRVAVRLALATSLPREKNEDDGGSNVGVAGFATETEEDAVERAIVRIQDGGNTSGGLGGLQERRAGACRLALLLGVSPPAPPVTSVQHRRLQQQIGAATAAGAGAVAADHLSSSVPGGRRRGSLHAPPAVNVKRSSTSGNSESSSAPPPAYSTLLNGGRGGGGRERVMAGWEEEAASMNSQDLEEALFPTSTTAAAGPVSMSPPGAPPARQRQGSSALPPAPASAGGVPSSSFEGYPSILPQAPSAAPKNARSDSEESLRRLLSIIEKDEGEQSTVAAAAADVRSAVRVQSVVPEDRGSSGPRGAGGGVYVDNSGGSARRGARGSADEDKITCKSCGRLVFAPKGFDLALIECPHCQQSMG